VLQVWGVEPGHWAESARFVLYLVVEQTVFGRAHVVDVSVVPRNKGFGL